MDWICEVNIDTLFALIQNKKALQPEDLLDVLISEEDMAYFAVWYLCEDKGKVKSDYQAYLDAKEASKKAYDKVSECIFHIEGEKNHLSMLQGKFDECLVLQDNALTQWRECKDDREGNNP